MDDLTHRYTHVYVCLSVICVYEGGFESVRRETESEDCECFGIIRRGTHRTREGKLRVSMCTLAGIVGVYVYIRVGDMFYARMYVCMCVCMSVLHFLSVSLALSHPPHTPYLTTMLTPLSHPLLYVEYTHERVRVRKTQVYVCVVGDV